MLELYQLNQQLLKQFNSMIINPWFENPIAEWCLDRSIDAALKMYYWPFFAITWEDKIKEAINSFSICKI